MKCTGDIYCFTNVFVIEVSQSWYANITLACWSTVGVFLGMSKLGLAVRY